MKQISTPSFRQFNNEPSQYEAVRPSKMTLEFIRSFARACKPLQMSKGLLNMSTIIIN